MNYVIQPSVVTDVTQSDKFFDVLNAFSDETSACEIFGFGRKHADIADSVRMININDPRGTSVNVLQTCIKNLDHAIGDWEHKLSKEVNDCVSKLFGANKARVKLLANDIKVYQGEVKEIQRMMHQAGAGETDALKQREQDIIDRIEHNRAMVHDLKKSIIISQEMYSNIQESTTLSKKGMGILLGEFKKYKATLDARNKPSDLRFGLLKDDDYVKELAAQRARFTDPDSDLMRELSQLSNAIDRINSSKIFNNEVSVDAATAVQYDLAITREMNDIYKKYRELCDKFHERLKYMSSQCALYKDHADDAHDSPEMIVEELVFLTAFAMRYSNFMMLYLHPQFGLIEAVSNAKYNI